MQSSFVRSSKDRWVNLKRHQLIRIFSHWLASIWHHQRINCSMDQSIKASKDQRIRIQIDQSIKGSTDEWTSRGMSRSSRIFSHWSASSTTSLPLASTISLTWIDPISCNRLTYIENYRRIKIWKKTITVSRWPSAAANSKGEQLSKPAVRIDGPYLRHI